MSIKRFYKDRLYIGVQDHNKDSWGDWQDITTAKVFRGKPDMGFYGDEVYEYTEATWATLRSRIQQEATQLNREFAEVGLPRQPLLTSYPIWV